MTAVKKIVKRKTMTKKPLPKNTKKMVGKGLRHGAKTSKKCLTAKDFENLTKPRKTARRNKVTTKGKLTTKEWLYKKADEKMVFTRDEVRNIVFVSAYLAVAVYSEGLYKDMANGEATAESIIITRKDDKELHKVLAFHVATKKLTDMILVELD